LGFVADGGTIAIIPYHAALRILWRVIEVSRIPQVGIEPDDLGFVGEAVAADV